MSENDEKNEENKEILDDVVFEETAEGEGEAFSKDKLKKLKEELKACQAERTDYLTNWQKERADFINYKKDEEGRRKQTIEYTREHFAEELMPVLDAYDLAFSNKDAWEKVDKNWRMGIEYIHQQLLKVLSENGISEITPQVGDSLDPNIHHSIESVSTEEKDKDHRIVSVAQKGYLMNGRVLRPARVNVYEFKSN